VALSFVSASTEAHFQLIEKRQGFEVARERIAGFEPAATPDAAGVVDGPPAPVPTGAGGIKGKRPSKKDKLRAAGLRPLIQPGS
jgi:hypothetical protein